MPFAKTSKLIHVSLESLTLDQSTEPAHLDHESNVEIRVPIREPHVTKAPIPNCGHNDWRLILISVAIQTRIQNQQPIIKGNISKTFSAHSGPRPDCQSLASCSGQTIPRELIQFFVALLPIQPCPGKKYSELVIAFGSAGPTSHQNASTTTPYPKEESCPASPVFVAGQCPVCDQNSLWWRDLCNYVVDVGWIIDQLDFCSR